MLADVALRAEGYKLAVDSEPRRHSLQPVLSSKTSTLIFCFLFFWHAAIWE